MSPFQVSFGLFVERVHFDIMPFFWFSSLDQSSHFVNSERIRENQNVRCWNRAIRIELLFNLLPQRIIWIQEKKKCNRIKQLKYPIQQEGKRFTFRWKSIFNCNANERSVMDKVLHERVHRHIFISISNHLIPIDMSVGLCTSVCARVRTLCAMVIMHVVANFDFIERCTRHNQFTSIEIQCKWFLVHVCLRFFFS